MKPYFTFVVEGVMYYYYYDISYSFNRTFRASLGGILSINCYVYITVSDKENTGKTDKFQVDSRYKHTPWVANLTAISKVLWKTMKLGLKDKSPASFLN